MGEVVHKEAEDSAEVVLRSGHGDFDGDGRLGVAVAAGGQGRHGERLVLIGKKKQWEEEEEGEQEVEEEEASRTTHNLCMRETMVLNAAWMSAVVQVQTTGRCWFCSMSERNWERRRNSS